MINRNEVALLVSSLSLVDIYNSEKKVSKFKKWHNVNNSESRKTEYKDNFPRYRKHEIVAKLFTNFNVTLRDNFMLLISENYYSFFEIQIVRDIGVIH